MRLAIAEDNQFLLSSLAQLLPGVGITVTATARTGDELMARMEATGYPDVAMVDLRMPPTFTDEGAALAERIKKTRADVGVLVFSAHADVVQAIRLLDLGVPGVGYLLKDRVADVMELRDALRRINGGENVLDPGMVGRMLARPRRRGPLEALAPREREVLRLMAEGRSNSGICDALRLGQKTVESYVANIFRKLDLAPSADDNRRVLAVVLWLREQPVL